MVEQVKKKECSIQHRDQEMKTRPLTLLVRSCVDKSSAVSQHRTLPRHAMDTQTERKFIKKMQRAVNVVENFLHPKIIHDRKIPVELIQEARGLVFLTVFKVGFLISAKVGKGFVLARTPTGWSAPSFLASGGVGLGLLAGGECIHYMIILGSHRALRTFTRDGQFQLSSEMDLAVGPVGRAAAANVNLGCGGVAPNYSYSHCAGLFGGIGLASALISTRKSFNARCYGSHTSVRSILSGAVDRPEAKELWKVLDEALGIQRLTEPITIQSRNNHQEDVAEGNGRPAWIPCDSCRTTANVPYAQRCIKCHALLVFSVGVHSGKLRTGPFVSSATV